MLSTASLASIACAVALMACSAEGQRPPSLAPQRVPADSPRRQASTARIGERRTSYTDAPNQFVDVGGRHVAYRRVGAGPPLILCNRFRGILDSWDPAFIDGLAAEFDVITFDYGGLGLSSGPPPSDIDAMAKDVTDLAAKLGIQRATLTGWSLGGLVAQTVLFRQPGLVNHLVLIGTLPPGKPEYPAEPAFLERAHEPVNDLDDEIVLFFEPASPASKRAAQLSHERIARRKRDLSRPVPPSHWDGLHRAGRQFLNDEAGVRQHLMRTTTPILIISGDHDVSCPVENWFVLSKKLPTATLVVFPRTGHGPHHEHVSASVHLVSSFVGTTR